MNRVMLYSGGLDSYLLSQAFPVVDEYVFLHYGVPDDDEFQVARATCPGRLVEHNAFDSYFFTNVPNPECEIPYRNLIFFLALARRYAEPVIFYTGLRPPTPPNDVRLEEGESIVGYDDTTPEFVRGVNDLFIGLGQHVSVAAPFAQETLEVTLERALAREVDFKVPILSCNRVHRTSVDNCGECKKCKSVQQALNHVKRPDLWDVFNAEASAIWKVA